MEDETPAGIAGRSTRLAGRLIAGRYRVENVVSTGANTIVTEAFDTESGQPVTVKIVQPDLAVSSMFREDFRQRIDIAKSLSHPNIAVVRDDGEVDLDGETTLFWVVDHLGGGSLRDLFDRGRLLAPSQALVVGLEACRALDAAHSRGIVHTEVTPSKLVFGVDGRLRITDFAMAELLGEVAWSEPATVPTHVARYASPEQALSQKVDDKTDVYALSLCLIEAITGSVPFAGDSTVSTLAARVGKLMPVTADMGSLAAVLERAGRPDPEDRWTAAEFGRALVQAAEALPRPEPVPVLASSLFASTLAARQAANAATAANAASAVASETDDDTESDTEMGTESETEGDVAPQAPPTEHLPAAEPPPGTVPLILLTDVADPPTGAVQVGTQADPATDADDAGSGDTVEAERPATVEMPAALAAAAAVATTPDGGAAHPVDPTPYDAEREGRPWGKYVLIGVVAVIGLVALGIAAFLLLRTKTYEVPDLVGVDQAVALNEIAGNDWVVETERERSDEVREIDHVVRTVPPAGEQLAEGDTFVMYVSDGPLFRTLPDFTGMPLDEARQTATEMELEIAEGEPEYSEDIPEGSIVAWSVQGDPALTTGGQVLPGAVIDVTVSRGPEPRPAPELVNLTPEEAIAAVEGLQLVFARGDDVFSSDVEAGRVAVQEPAPGTPVERGGTVTVQVSKGPELVPFPDLAGTTYPQAQQALADAGYVVNSLLGTTAGTFVSASVGGEEVSAGDTFPRGTGVDLIFL